MPRRTHAFTLLDLVVVLALLVLLLYVLRLDWRRARHEPSRPPQSATRSSVTSV